MEKTNKQVNLQVVKIKVTSFSFDDSYEGKVDQVDIDFNLNFDIRLDEEKVALIVNIHIYPKENREIEIINLKCATEFRIHPLKDFQVSNQNSGEVEINLPDQLMATLFSISFSHSRAVLAMKTEGTNYSHLMLPTVNPTEIMKQLFSEKNNK